MKQLCKHIASFFQSAARAYLFVALFAFALAMGLQWLFFQGASQQRYVQEVKQRLFAQMTLADEAFFEFKETFKAEEVLTFSAFTRQTYPHPLFVFRRGELVFWSDYRYKAPYYELEGNYLERTIYLPSLRATFVVKRTTLQVKNEDYEIFALILLERTYNVESTAFVSGLNPDIFPDSNLRIRKDKNEGVGIYYERNSSDLQDINYLFSVIFPENFLYYADKNWVVLFFMGIGAVAFLFFINQYVKELFQAKKGIQAVITLGVLVMGLRGFLWLLFLPDTPLFLIPRLYDTQAFAHPLVGMLLNIFTLFFIIAFLLRYFRYWASYRKIANWEILGKRAFSAALVVLTYTAAHWVYFRMAELHNYETLSLDINQSIHFTPLRIVGLLIFLFVVFVYFVVAHVSSKFILHLSDSLQELTVNFVIGSVGYYLVTMLLGIENLLLFNMNAAYLSLITFLGMPQSLMRTGYKPLIYLILFSGIGATLGSYSVFIFEQRRDIQEKEEIAKQLILKRDTVAEGQLRSAVRAIQGDQLVQRKLQGGLPFSYEPVEQRIKKIHLRNYLGKYETDITLYSSAGQPLLGSGPTYIELYQQYNQKRFLTEQRNLFYLNEPKREKKQYLFFSEMYDNDRRLMGFIVLRLRFKKFIPNSLQEPFLFSNDRREIPEADRYSYAIYSEGELAYSFGDFAYDNNFLELFQHEKGFMLPELIVNNYHHLRLKRDEQVVVVSSTVYPQGDMLSNFSFLFLLLVFTCLLNYFIYGFSRTAHYNLTFATKVQLYLNLAFFVPLFIVSIITVSILNNTNERETQFYFLEKARNVSESDNLISSIVAYNRGTISRDQLQLEVTNIADFAQADLNLYDRKGRLLVTSQRYVFDQNLLSEYVNAQAYAGVVEQKQRKMLLNEELGTLSYNSAYVGIQSYETGEVIGIVGIPFFGASLRFESQIIEVFTTIVQTFTFLFILLVILSYFSAKSLIHPIRLITQKIRRTTLQEHNEPLDYHADDEFGLLAGEYNKMIVKLEESRDALAHSQKEAAWREMAKQVAHEIKNPLTPMKLTLQQLQRRMGNEKPIEILLEQVDILSDIATSFASFAKMPIPQSEEFEIASVLRRALNLHEGNRTVELVVDIPDEEFFIVGDSQLMHRIFTNLLLNGIQSVSPEKEARVEVSLTPLYPERILIEIKDNGEGIPEHIRHKIFMPNFTTKITGSGIGLALAKRGIEHSGGAIWFDSMLGEGTSFFVELPLCR